MAASGYLSVQDAIGGRGAAGEVSATRYCDSEGTVGRVGLGIYRTVMSLGDRLA